MAKKSLSAGMEDYEEEQSLMVVKKQHPKAKPVSVPDTTPPRPGCVVYVGRLPHGFYEAELRAYFSQFGSLSRLRISRNPRTGASRHYGFIEFEHPEVAQVVVETMHNYLLFGHLLQVKLVNEVHEECFVGASKKFVKIPWRRIASRAHEQRDRSKTDGLERVKGRLDKAKERAQQAGIDYDFAQIYIKQ